MSKRTAVADAYERGHDDAIDTAIEEARLVLAEHPDVLHRLEQRLIAHLSPSGRKVPADREERQQQ